MECKFIVIEGIDGSGKSTLAANLEKYISQFFSCIKINEPTELNIWGRELRKILRSKVKPDNQLSIKLRRLFRKDRLWDIQNRIQPALLEKKIVILDRYYFSTAAYQAISEENADEIMKEYTEDKRILHPDCIFYLKIEPDYTLKRISARYGKEEIFENKELLSRIYQHYEYIVKKYSKKYHIIKLDAYMNENDLTQKALEALGIR